MRIVTGISSPDPYVLNELNQPSPGLRGGTLTRGTQTLNTSIRNLILIWGGQSNGANVIPSAYTASNPTKIDVFNIYDGAIYVAGEPLYGCTYAPTLGPGNIAYTVADYLITNNKFDRVIIVPNALGGTNIASWGSGSLVDRGPATMRRLAQRGLVSGTNVYVAEVFIQGEADVGIAQATYAASASSRITNMRAAGTIGRHFIPLVSYAGGATDSNIRAAQTGLWNGSTIFSGGDLDSYGSGSRQADNLHFNNTGRGNVANAIYAAMTASGAPF